MDTKQLSRRLECILTSHLTSAGRSFSAREDSRAFGGMIERSITDGWSAICAKAEVVVLADAGTKSIYDAAFRPKKGQIDIVGVDVRTKDLDAKKYTDGGVCSVKNLLQFMLQEKGILLVAEIGHTVSKQGFEHRVIGYVRVKSTGNDRTASSTKYSAPWQLAITRKSFKHHKVAGKRSKRSSRGTMPASLSSDDEVQIGAVFTPLEVGAFAVRTFGVVDRWLEGSTVFDPTMGQGHLLEALVDEAINRGVELEDVPFERLFGNELSAAHRNKALEKFAGKYGVDMGAQFTHGDVLTLTARAYDIILGNPPWVSYVDLPEDYRSSIKPLFADYGLVDEQRDLLLGKSRIDLAALIVQRVVADFQVDGGEAILFLPLSLLLNDGAHACFRRFRVHGVSFAVLNVYDYNTCQAFPGVNTRYGLVRIRRGHPATYPVPYRQMENDTWSDFLASPLLARDDPWSISSPEQLHKRFELPEIVLKKESQPRQGVNTGGANDVFFFEHVTPLDSGLAEVLTSDGSIVLLPQRFLFPLVTANVFRARGEEPSKWVVLPYNTDGRILSSVELGMERELDAYFQSKRQRLQQRKGVMLNATIKRGMWWTMLGVGPYCFYPYKVIWESYGRSTFRPMIIPGHWQANQSLQAFIPLRTREEAEHVLERLEHHSIEDYLRSLQMEGTMNWAQPGKIKKLITAIS